jgi:hypothetical protein
MKITKRQPRGIIKEMANQEQDFVVGGYSGGYSSNSERYDYIVSAINKNEAKKILKAVKPHLRKINANPVSDYTQFNPYTTFKRLGESVSFNRGDQMKITRNQLRKIIKEERAKLLVEMNPAADAERSLGLYANASTVDKLSSALQSLLMEVETAAIEDGLEDYEAEDMAANAGLLAVAQAFQSVGMIAEYDALYRILQQG